MFQPTTIQLLLHQPPAVRPVYDIPPLILSRPRRRWLSTIREGGRRKPSTLAPLCCETGHAPVQP